MNAQIKETVNEILKPSPNWEVRNIKIHEGMNRINIQLGIAESASFICNRCNELLSEGYQSKMKSFRYLKIMGYETFLTVEQPWFECTHMGMQAIPIPWEQDVKDSLFLSNSI